MSTHTFLLTLLKVLPLHESALIDVSVVVSFDLEKESEIKNNLIHM
jgi:hypothetical protein